MQTRPPPIRGGDVQDSNQRCFQVLKHLVKASLRLKTALSAPLPPSATSSAEIQQYLGIIRTIHSGTIFQLNTTGPNGSPQARQAELAWSMTDQMATQYLDNSITQVRDPFSDLRPPSWPPEKMYSPSKEFPASVDNKVVALLELSLAANLRLCHNTQTSDLQALFGLVRQLKESASLPSN